MSTLKITPQELLSFLEDPQAHEAELARFLETKEGSRAFAPELQLRPEVELVVEPPLVRTRGVKSLGKDITRIAIDIEHKKRLKRYEAQREEGLPVVVAEGDSWFEHPLRKDIIDVLSQKYAIRCVSSAGAELGDMVKQAEYVKYIDSEQPSLFLFSAGGNDVVGDEFKQWIKKEGGDPRDPASFIQEAYHQHVLKMARWFRSVVAHVHGVRPETHIIVHGYDYAIPYNARVERGRRILSLGAGHWMHRPLEAAKVHDPELQVAIVKEMVDLWNTALQDEVIKKEQRVHYVDLRDTLKTRKAWYDELHPEDPGYKALARKIDDVMERILKEQR